MNILIAGDFFILDSFKNTELIGNCVTNLFNNSDYNILNLESPLTENIKKERINKIGPHLQSNPQHTITFLEKLNIDLVTLANNHIMDYGKKGLENTFDFLKKNKINHVGSGLNLSQASQFKIIKKEDLTIAILNFAENEWSIAKENKAGANPLDIINNSRQIKEASLKCDKVICIIHGGHEYNNYPSPSMVKHYKYYVECGADAIICHHTHCFSGTEIYRGSPIIYGLGNFIFTLDNQNNSWYKGLVVDLIVDKNENIRFNLIPVTQEKSTFSLKVSKDDEKHQILNEVSSYSKIITNPDLLNLQWAKFVDLKKEQYLFSINPIQFFNNKYLLSAFRKINLDKLLFNKKLKTKFLHLIRCEAHKELVISVLDED
jgi:poly-gamma-glutamate capsule biosynthesis protein CapA/YwtB (metallophosphatase superfamily)